ncbi:hypothetical protein HQ544_03870 [Candidatus Falkowbacteria bacterium]|nr:hypothetical protein [Candidatus Falkowbacteria bacterium]
MPRINEVTVETFLDTFCNLEVIIKAQLESWDFPFNNCDWLPMEGCGRDLFPECPRVMKVWDVVWNFARVGEIRNPRYEVFHGFQCQTKAGLEIVTAMDTLGVQALKGDEGRHVIIRPLKDGVIILGAPWPVHGGGTNFGYLLHWRKRINEGLE